MAAVSMMFGVSASSHASFTPKGIGNSSALFTSKTPFRFSSPISFQPSFWSSPRFLSRESYRVKATVIQETEDQVVIEESSPPKSSPGSGGGGSNGEPPQNTSSNGLEKWVIKLEQSVNIFLTDTVIKMLDTLYHDRHYARFFVLETIARVPYFAFMSVLHMYESFGWWRRADYLKVHFAESWNEMHHLLIMEVMLVLQCYFNFQKSPLLEKPANEMLFISHQTNYLMIECIITSLVGVSGRALLSLKRGREFKPPSRMEKPIWPAICPLIGPVRTGISLSMVRA